MTVLRRSPPPAPKAWRWADLGALAAAAALAADRRAASRCTSSTFPARGCCSSTASLDDARQHLGRVTLADIAAADHALGRARARPGWSLAPRRGRRRRPGPDRPRRHRRATTICPPRSSSPTTRSRTWSRPIVGTGWSNRFTRTRRSAAARGSSARSACSRPRASSRCATRPSIGEARQPRRRLPRRGRRGQPHRRADHRTGEGAYAEYGGALLTARRAAAGMRGPRPPRRRRTASRTSSGARSPPTAPPPASPPRSRSRATRRRPTASSRLRGLLLHRTATVNLKPELEIFADDVKCAHGATVGELDARALFYMESRGIPHRARQGAADPRLRGGRARPDRRRDGARGVRRGCRRLAGAGAVSDLAAVMPELVVSMRMYRAVIASRHAVDPLARGPLQHVSSLPAGEAA